MDRSTHPPTPSEVEDAASDVGLLAQALHALHVVFDGGGVGDLCGTAGRKPAPFSVSHSLPVAPLWQENRTPEVHIQAGVRVRG